MAKFYRKRRVLVGLVVVLLSAVVFLNHIGPSFVETYLYEARYEARRHGEDVASKLQMFVCIMTCLQGSGRMVVNTVCKLRLFLVWRRPLQQLAVVSQFK